MLLQNNNIVSLLYGTIEDYLGHSKEAQATPSTH